MPTRTPARKKKTASAKRPSTKKRTVAKAKKKVSAAKRLPAKPKIIGRVTHYYDRIGVAIVELATPLMAGDTVTFKRGEHEHTQRIDSMQIEHQQVAKAKKGDVIGVKVSKEIQNGTFVLPA